MKWKPIAGFILFAIIVLYLVDLIFHIDAIPFVK